MPDMECRGEGSHSGRWFWRRVPNRLLRTPFDVGANCPAGTARSWPSMRIARGCFHGSRRAAMGRHLDGRLALQSSSWRQARHDCRKWVPCKRWKLQAQPSAPQLQRGELLWGHPPPPLSNEIPKDPLTNDLGGNHQLESLESQLEAHIWNPESNHEPNSKVDGTRPAYSVKIQSHTQHHPHPHPHPPTEP